MAFKKLNISDITNIINNNRSKNLQLVLNLGPNSDISVEKYNLSKLDEINRNPVKLFDKMNVISKKEFNMVNQRLSNVNKRIYKMKIYGLRYKSGLNLENYKMDIQITMPYVFYEVHRNGSFYFAELFEKTEYGCINEEGYSLKIQEKTTFKPDMFPILDKYDYESDTYECVEYLFDGDNMKIIAYSSDKGDCYINIIKNIDTLENSVKKINEVVEKYVM